MLLDALSAGTTTIFSWISALSRNIWIIKRFMSARHGSTEYWVTPVYQGHYRFNPFWQGINLHALFLGPASCIRFVEFCFQVKDLGIRIRIFYWWYINRHSFIRETWFPVFRTFGKNDPKFDNHDYIEVSCYDVTGWIIAELRGFTGTRWGVSSNVLGI